jgi:hypothetical protein
VDRVIVILIRTIHEITRSYAKEPKQEFLRQAVEQTPNWTPGFAQKEHECQWLLL